MRIGTSGAEAVGVLRQPRRGAGFEPWPDAQVLVVEREEGVFELGVSGPATELSGFGIILRLPLSGPDVRVHHPALVRMRNCGSLPAEADWTIGPRSELASEFHFAQRPGEPPFGMPPFAVCFDSKTSWFVGAASEHRAKLSLSWSRDDEGVVVEARWERWGRETYLSGSDWPGERLALGPGGAEAYFAGLDIPTRPAEATSPRFWGSWNDGIYRDIDERRILATADWLKACAPSVGWVQVDDGWANPSDEAPMSHFGVLYEPERIAPDARFPQGMKGLARAIKERGLRPMIWITPGVAHRSRLFQEHPDWFQERTRLYFMPELRFFDTSRTAVRRFIEDGFRTIFHDWGFEGAKLDFWTMGFDLPEIDFADPSADGVSEMRWFVETIRRYLPSDGLLLHCIDLPFGSPFRSRGFDAFRYYADSEGSCQQLATMKEQALWAAHLVGHYRCQRWWRPDGDGLGRFRHFDMPDAHFSLWLSFLAGSGSLAELAGWLHEGIDDPRRESIRRALPFSEPGEIIELPGFDFYAADGEPPKIWASERADGTKLVALTNWDAAPMAWTSDASGRDVFSGEAVRSGELVTVAAEAGRLLLLDPSGA